MTATFVCPICKKAAGPLRENPSFPFCSHNCKMVDLGKWLNGDYRIPVGPAEDDEDGASTPSDSDEEPS